MRIPPMLLVTAALAAVLAGCGDPGTAAETSTTATAVIPTTSASGQGVPPIPMEACAPPITTPTLPAVIPGEAELDPDTGLHVTGTPVEVDPATYRLEVTGLVDYPLSLTYDELRCLPRVEAAPQLNCPGYFVDEATWAGTPLRDVLQLAGVQEEATRARLIAADGYSLMVDLTPETLVSAFLAYEVEGEPLPVLHGFPVRFVSPGHFGYDWVKWLVAIEVS